jgi:hypothetical protein
MLPRPLYFDIVQERHASPVDFQNQYYSSLRNSRERPSEFTHRIAGRSSNLRYPLILKREGQKVSKKLRSRPFVEIPSSSGSMAMRTLE